MKEGYLQLKISELDDKIIKLNEGLEIIASKIQHHIIEVKKIIDDQNSCMNEISKNLEPIIKANNGIASFNDHFKILIESKIDTEIKKLNKKFNKDINNLDMSIKKKMNDSIKNMLDDFKVISTELEKSLSRRFTDTWEEIKKNM